LAGDKSNHVATIHLPQLLYLSAFIAFFSFPILIPSILHFIQPLLSALVPSLRPPPTSSSSSAKISRTKVLITGISVLGSLLAILVITRFNTLIHPFTLADNRHYIFYVFRYSILFHPLIRYLLAPIYLLCIYLTYLTLSGSPPLFLSSSSASRTAPSSPTKPTRPKTAVHHRIQAPSKPTQDSGPSTSFLLIYLLSTALCLITAPLVEPRYFILPWILWRLHVPSYSHSPHPRKGRQGWNLGAVLTFWLWKGHDYRLWLETIWFLAINAVTGYVFLYRRFEWVQEPGKVQRFMW
jgi:alpha-1,2-glucosyltransferase